MASSPRWNCPRRGRRGYNLRMRKPFLLLLGLLVCLPLLGGCDMFTKTKLEDSVAKALKADSRTSHYTFEISADENGQVKITGELDKAEDWQVISDIAKGVPGVKSVLNNCAMPEPGSDMMNDTVVDPIVGL